MRSLLEGAKPESLARDQRHHESFVAVFERAQTAGALRTDLPAATESEGMLVQAIMTLIHAPAPTAPEPSPSLT